MLGNGPVRFGGRPLEKDPRGHLASGRPNPRSWTEDPERCAQAGVPDDIEFLTKPALATGMICRALDAGVAGAVGGRRRGLRR